MDDKTIVKNAVSGGQQSPGIIPRVQKLLPYILLASVFALPFFIFSKTLKGDFIGLGPAVWPKGMLWGIGIFSVFWIIRDIWAKSDSNRKPTLVEPDEDTPYDFTKASIGLVMIVTYGWLLPMTGFALTTALFIAIWCLFGGIRDLKVVVPVSVVGTVALLWLFMGLALMPLPRGLGIFESFSIGLLKLIGIY